MIVSTHINGQFAGDYTSIDKVPAGKEVTPIQKPNEFIKGFWNGTEWIETITQEEINEKIVVEYTSRIKEAFTSLRRRALGSSIGKTGSWEYLYEQSQQYKDKYNVAKGTYINTVVSQMIADEANDFGIDAPTMNAMIIQMYEAGEIAYYQFNAMIERARTKAITLMDNLEFTRSLQVIELMENVPEVLTMQDAENLSLTLISI